MVVRKEDYDVARLFIAYLAFCGDVTKVSIATRIPPEVIEVLAAMEDWSGKLKVYQLLRHDDRQSKTECAMCRAAAFITAHHLREVIRKLLDRLYSIKDTDDLMKTLSAYDPRSNKLKLRSRAIGDLTRALNVAEKIIAREQRAARGEPASRPTVAEDFETKESRTLREAVWRALDAADNVLGFDSVAAMEESLAVWKSGGAG